MRERERMGERRSARPYKTLTFTLRLNFFFAHIFSKGSKLNGDDMENVIKMFVLRLDLLRSGTRQQFSFYGWTCCDQGPDKNFRFTLGPAAIRDQTKIYRFTVGPAAIRDQIKKKKKIFIFLGWTCCCDQRDLRAN